MEPNSGCQSLGLIPYHPPSPPGNEGTRYVIWQILNSSYFSIVIIMYFAVGWGRIVNISSVHGLVGSPMKGPYVASKHGLIGLTKVNLSP